MPLRQSASPARRKSSRGRAFLVKQRDRVERAVDEFGEAINKFETEIKGQRDKFEARVRKLGASIDKIDDAFERRRQAIERKLAALRRRAAERVEGEIGRRTESIENTIDEFRSKIDLLDQEFTKRRDAIELKIKAETRFIRNWLEKPLVTGAVAPSGPALARMMARYVDPAIDGPIVELGPGTGPVTEALIERGVPQSRLILIEYSKDFADMLRERFPGARVVQGDAYNMRETLAGVLTSKAAATVSSLPLLNKPGGERLSLLQQAFGLMQYGGPFIQFTYGAASPMPVRKTGFAVEKSPRVWKNLPPARVWVYRKLLP